MYSSNSTEFNAYNLYEGIPMFNSDSTGAIDIDWSQGQEEDFFVDTFTWTSDDSQININYSDPDNGSEILYYSFVQSICFCCWSAY